MATVKIRATINESDKRQLTIIAEKTGQSQNQNIARAIHDHVQREKSFIEMVQKGQNSKEYLDHNEVDNWLASWGTETESSGSTMRSE